MRYNVACIEQFQLSTSYFCYNEIDMLTTLWIPYYHHHHRRGFQGGGPHTNSMGNRLNIILL